jgi:hypothetical protein
MGRQHSVAINSFHKLHEVNAYTVCSVTVSGIQDLIPEAISRQKCYMNMDPVLYGYEDMGI